MPFSPCNALATFERLMERVLANIPRSHCVVYLDDLLVHASYFSKALGHLTGVLSAIRHAGLRLNPAKCHLLQRETTFLSHVVSAERVATNPEKVAAVQDWPIPVNVCDLCSFLGLAFYYHCFVRNFASVAAPLQLLTDKEWPLVWTDSCDTAFNKLKAALTAAPILAYPHADLPYVVDTVDSGTGIGAVLSLQSRSQSREEELLCHTPRIVGGGDGSTPFVPLFARQQVPPTHRSCLTDLAFEFQAARGISSSLAGSSPNLQL
uniref:ribonuclease H n=1 Tax=Knipowitschia caucasica TaxID=637954 RepID=A0AAV2IYC9_KNICA